MIPGTTKPAFRRATGGTRTPVVVFVFVGTVAASLCLLRATEPADSRSIESDRGPILTGAIEDDPGPLQLAQADAATRDGTAAAPLPPTPPRTTTPRTRPLADARPRLASTRLARSPEMFGDLFITQQLYLQGPPAGGSESSDVFAPGNINSFSQKISENNHPLPRDRVFYLFNAFDDALVIRSAQDVFLNSATSSQSFLRHTFGVEKTFLDGQTSIEVRMPFFSSSSVTRDIAPLDHFGFDAGSFGNLLITGKMLITQTDQFVASTGMGLMAPTASDVRATAGGSTMITRNEAVYLSPFFATMWTPDDDWFLMTFSQVQVGTTGDDVVLRDFDGSSRIGRLNAPAASMFDLSLGRWLFRDREQAVVSGMALISEIHTFQALQSSDTLSGVTPPLTTGRYLPADRLSLTTMTLGIHTQLWTNSTLRLAGVVPLTSADYDGELVVQFNVFY